MWKWNGKQDDKGKGVRGVTSREDGGQGGGVRERGEVLRDWVRRYIRSDGQTCPGVPGSDERESGEYVVCRHEQYGNVLGPR